MRFPFRGPGRHCAGLVTRSVTKMTILTGGMRGPFAPVTFSAPPNPARIGHDLFSDSVEAGPLRTALESGETICSEPYRMSLDGSHYRLSDDVDVTDTEYRPPGSSISRGPCQHPLWI